MTPAELKIKRWREDPVTFVREALNAEPDAWQVDVLRAFPVKQRLAMKASKGCGKSTILAWLAWNFLSTRPQAKIAATSISGDNLADGLWTEMAKWQQRSPFLKQAFQWNKTRIFAKDHPETWWMSARTWAKGADSSQQANTLAGLHADYMLFILDEVGSIPDSVMAAAEAGLSSGIDTKILMAGNPTHLDGPLYRASTSERHLWDLTEITSDPDDPKRSPRVSIQWAREQIEKYGRDNPWVLVNVFGKYPPSSLNTLLGPDEVNASMNRVISEDKYNFIQRRVGVDVARFGDDRTVIFPRQGLMSFKPVEMRGARSNEVAARVALAKSKWAKSGTKDIQEIVDGTGGYGAGVVDSLIQGGHAPLEISFSGKASDSRYLNKRAEMWFTMAEWIKKGGKLPNMPELTKELTTVTYTFQNGKFQIEPKEQLKSRLGSSPDLADALCLTFCNEDHPAHIDFPGYENPGEKLQSEWDPLESKD